MLLTELKRFKVRKPYKRKKGERPLSSWNYAQRLACTGEVDYALWMMNRCLIPDDEEWNDYVSATRAFLLGNEREFIKYLGVPNEFSHIFDKLWKNWGENYDKAYNG